MTSSGQGADPGLWTAANLVTLARLGAIPVFAWLVLRGDFGVATLVLLGIGASDWLDGQLARHLGQISEIGRVLDPLADRLAIATAVIAGWIASVVPVWFAMALLVRELVLATLALLLIVRRRQVIQVRFLGKLATFVVYGALPAFYLAAADVVPSLLYAVGVTAGAAGLLLYWWVGVVYIADYRRLLGQEAASV